LRNCETERLSVEYKQPERGASIGDHMLEARRAVNDTTVLISTVGHEANFADYV
jgi:hypothetical protein